MKRPPVGLAGGQMLDAHPDDESTRHKLERADSARLITKPLSDFA